MSDIIGTIINIEKLFGVPEDEAAPSYSLPVPTVNLIVTVVAAI